MDKKKIIIIGAVAVLLIGGVIGFSVLNKEEEYEIPIVNEDVIPEYDHSATPEKDTPQYDGNLIIDNNASVDEDAVPINPEDIDKIVPDEEILNEIGTVTDEDILDAEPETIPVVVPEIKDGEEKPEGYDEFLEMLEAMNGAPEETTPSTPNDEPIIQEDPTVNETPVEDTGLTARTDAQVTEVLNNFANNFKSSSAINTVTDFGMQYLDANLDTLKNNPESDESIKLYIEYYKNGSMSEDKFTYMIENWLRSGGSFGDAKSSVQ